MGEPGARRATYEDYRATPESEWWELVDGRLHRWGDPDGSEGAAVTFPSPAHQRAAGAAYRHLARYAREHGGEAFAAGIGVRLGPDTVVGPDAVLLSADRLGLVGREHIDGAPDLVVEVSSPSTRRHDLLRKRRLYEDAGVLEFWSVDLEAQRVEVYRHGKGGYGTPVLVGRGEVIRAHLPGLEVPVDELLGGADPTH